MTSFSLCPEARSTDKGSRTGQNIANDIKGIGRGSTIILKTKSGMKVNISGENVNVKKYNNFKNQKWDESCPPTTSQRRIERTIILKTKSGMKDTLKFTAYQESCCTIILKTKSGMKGGYGVSQFFF